MRAIPIFHFGRSGSTVLARLLGRHPKCISLGEVFTDAFDNGTFLKDPADFISVVENHPTRLMAAPGASICFFEIKNLNLRNGLTDQTLEPLLVDFREHFGDQITLLRRRNTLKRIASSLRAAKNQVYHVKAGAEPPQRSAFAFRFPLGRSFDFSTRARGNDIVNLLEKAELIEAAVCTSIRTIYRNVLELWYEEDVEKNPNIAACRAWQFAGVENISAAVAFSKTSGGLRSDLENYEDVAGALAGTRFEWMAT